MSPESTFQLREQVKPLKTALMKATDEANQFFRWNGRLAMFRKESPDREYWEKRWNSGNLEKYLRAYRSGKLDEFEEIFTRFLPKGLPVLEAGCGKAQLVAALAARGYQVEGLDYAETTVNRIRSVAPELNVRTGDIYALDVPNGHYGGYISIGLFEHNPDGPSEALKETRRVLHPQGVALISVPYLNRRRGRILNRVEKAPGIYCRDEFRFYQYYFSVEEFETYVNSAGLKVVERYPYGVYTGLVRDSALWRRWSKSRLFIWPLQRRFIHWCATAPRPIRFASAHMMMFVCRHR